MDDNICSSDSNTLNYLSQKRISSINKDYKIANIRIQYKWLLEFNLCDKDYLNYLINSFFLIG